MKRASKGLWWLCALSFFSMQSEQYDFIVDFGVILYPNYNKATTIIKKRAGMNNPVNLISAAFGAGKLWLQGKNIEDELERRLNVFLSSLSVPPDIPYQHKSALRVHNRQKYKFYDYSPIFCAFLCSPNKKTEKKIRDFVLTAFKKTTLDEITELNNSFKKVLLESINVMFDSDYLYDLLEVDKIALATLEQLNKTKKILFVHNLPGAFDLTKLKDKQITAVTRLVHPMNVYAAHSKGIITTNPAFYEQFTFPDHAIFITTDDKNSEELKTSKKFNTFVVYDYKKPKKLTVDLRL